MFWLYSIVRINLFHSGPQSCSEVSVSSCQRMSLRVVATVLCLLLLLTRGSMSENEASGVRDLRKNQFSSSPKLESVTPSNSGATSLPKEHCPTWFTTNTTSGACECGNSCGEIVRCEQHSNRTSMLLCYCMTYSGNTPVVGACFPGCFLHAESNSFYAPLDPNVIKMQKMMCGHMKRDGQLCGKCQYSYSPPIYSYHLECVWCPAHTSNWIKYITITFLPLTVFFITVVGFRISTTSAPMNAFILVAQLVSTPVEMRIITGAQGKHPFNPLLKGLSDTILSLYGIWNLDFFRTVYSPFCLHAGMSTLQALSFDYIIALYPLVLVGVTYVLVQLHDSNFRIVVWLWKPFHWCTARFRRQWNIKTSLIDAFATFLLLSYVKLLSVSFDLLVPTKVYQIDGRPLPSYYLYFDGSIEFFGRDHLPYGITALLVLVIFIVLPLILLIIYPCRCFQRFLGLFQFRFHALHTFMDAFQGCYKNGTNGTRDCRYFAAVYLFVRVLLYLVYTITLSVFYYLMASAVLMISALLVAVAQPYRTHFYNVLDIVLIIMPALFYVSLMGQYIGYKLNSIFLSIAVVLLAIAIIFPLGYLAIFLLHWVISTKRIARRIFRKIKSLMPASLVRNPTHLEDSLPHRLTHAGEYTASQEHTPLLSTVTDNISHTGEQSTC